MRLSENIKINHAFIDDENDLILSVYINESFTGFCFDKNLTRPEFIKFCRSNNLDENETRENILFYIDETENFFDRYKLTYIRKLI